MIEAPIPEDDRQRLAALLELGILDTPAEARFDRITRIARDLFGVPIALISLVDERRQWFKAASGLDSRETPRSISFCGHAILGADALVVEDALEDPRFADNPLVTGEPRVRFYAGMPLRAHSGWKLGTLCLIDRTPRRFGSEDVRRLADLAAWAESELNRSAAVEAATAEMRDTFVRLVSHELRTPVTSILGALDLIHAGVAEGAEADSLTSIAREGAGRLSRVVHDIVEIAQFDAGHQKFAVAAVELAPLAAAATVACEAAAFQSGIRLAREIPPDLVVQADARRLARILGILLDNALRFSPAGGSVVVAAQRLDQDRARLSVSDSGPGIPAAHVPRLFRPFVQADAADNRHHGGVGLGLAISQRLAAAMDARLGYEPGEAGGSRFFIDLPT